MEVNTQKIGQDILKWTVVGGSAVIAVNSVMQLFKSTSVKSAIMPAVTLLVGVSAFSYAMTADKISLMPKLGESDSDSDEKSSFSGRRTTPNIKGFTPAGTTMPTAPVVNSSRKSKISQSVNANAPLGDAILINIGGVNRKCYKNFKLDVDGSLTGVAGSSWWDGTYKCLFPDGLANYNPRTGAIVD